MGGCLQSRYGMAKLYEDEKCRRINNGISIISSLDPFSQSLLSNLQPPLHLHLALPRAVKSKRGYWGKSTTLSAPTAKPTGRRDEKRAEGSETTTEGCGYHLYLKRLLGHRSSREHSLVLASALLAVGRRRRLVLVLLFLLVLWPARVDGAALVLAGRNPEAGIVVHAEGSVLRGEVDGLAGFVRALVAALGEGASAGAELRLDGCVLRDPVGQGVFAVLDDAGIER